MYLENEVFVPWRVFVSFNTESACRGCFMASASAPTVSNVRLALNDAPEPNEIIYDNSDVTSSVAFSANAFSYTLALGVLVVSYIIVYYLNLVKGTGMSLVVTAVIVGINAALPFVMKHLTFIFETHHNREVIQQSILVKLLLSRCIVSAVIIYHVTPYQEKFSIATLETIQDIMLADAIVPLFRAIDVYGYFSRYILAPILGQDQETFNLFWRGTEYNLAERYANVLKTVFTALFFAVPMPTGLFIGAVTLGANYVSDKYLLMHKWKKMPPIGAGLGRLCRIMFMFILFIHCLISLHFFANWPYRGVCGGDKAKVPNCHLTCDVNSAMTDTQAHIVHLYNVFSVVGLVIMILWMLKIFISTYLVRYVNIHAATSKVIPSVLSHASSAITLRSINNARAYVPTVKRDLLAHRLLCADLSQIPTPYNYAAKTMGLDEVQFEPLTMSKLNLSEEVMTSLMHTCGKISYYITPTTTIEVDLSEKLEMGPSGA
jgi:hypothetical protein